jgi:hypothetical protein
VAEIMPISTIATFLEGRCVATQTVVSDLMKVMFGCVCIVHHQTTHDHFGELIINGQCRFLKRPQHYR